MLDDIELLRRYAENHSEESFTELVRRRLSLVYSVALRRVGGDAHLANDVTQRVFTDLARKAAALSRRQVLTGWLFTSTRYAAAEAVRREKRRQAHEQDAQTMQNLFPDSVSNGNWDRLRPVLDDLINELGESDREAVLLRFFEGRPFAEVGAKLHLSENTARMRVERAVDKLRALLARRGIPSTTVALATLLANQTSIATPIGMAGAVASAALSGAALTGAAAGSASAFWQFITMNKITLGIASLVAASGVVTSAVELHSNQTLRNEIAGLRQQPGELDRLQLENTRLREKEAELTRAAQDARGATPAPTVAKSAETVSVPPLLPVLHPQPVPLDRTPPIYPADLKAAGISGRVMVDFIVDTAGSVRNAYASGSSQREFEAPAVKAVAQWVFRPGQFGPRTVNTHMEVPILFGFSDAPEIPSPNPPRPSQEAVVLATIVQRD